MLLKDVNMLKRFRITFYKDFTKLAPEVF